MAISTIKQNRLNKAQMEVTKQRRFIESQNYYPLDQPYYHPHLDYDKAIAVSIADSNELNRLQDIVTELEKKYGIR